MIINHSTATNNILRNLWQNTNKIHHVQEKLASGLRINRAADDAAGLAISEVMFAQISGLHQADRNSQDAASLIQTADGALSNTGSVLGRMRELAVQAANGTYSANDRQLIQAEMDQLTQELNRISKTTSFNNKNLLDGTGSAITSTDNSNTQIFMRGILGANYAGSYQMNIAVNTVGAAEQQTSRIMTDKATNATATAGTQLKDVAQFYDQNGRFLLANPQTITLVQGDGKQASFTISGDDTMADVAAKFNQAIANPEAAGGLNQGVLLGGNQFGTFTTVTTPNSMEAVAGQFCLRSAIVGDTGTINVVADEQIMNAFGFTDYQAAKNAEFQVTVTNSATGQQVSQQMVNGNVARGIIGDNVDVRFDPTVAQTAVYSAASATIQVNAGAAANINISLTPNNPFYQIGANEKEIVTAGIGNMSAAALGVDNLQLTDMGRAGKAITKIDAALQTVGKQRAQLGAVQNRLDFTSLGLQIGAENLTASESRIRDADMAFEMMEFNRLKIMNQFGLAMGAQSNSDRMRVLKLLFG